MDNPLYALLDQLFSKAQPRPTLVSPDYAQSGLDPRRPVATFAGRVTQGDERVLDILARTPQESPDAEGLGGLAAWAVLARRGTQDLVKEWVDRGIRENVQSRLRDIAKRTRLGDYLKTTVTDERMAVDLAKHGSTVPDLGAVFRTMFTGYGNDPRFPITTIMQSGWLGDASIMERAAITKLVDMKGDLERLVTPENLKRVRAWYTAVLPDAPTRADVLTRYKK